MKVQPLALACLAAAALMAGNSHAQTTTPAKPAARASAKPAATPPTKPTGGDGRTATFSGGNGAGPILSRDELRVCITQEDTVRTRTEAHNASRAPVDQEKAAIASEQAAMVGERSAVDAIRTGADELAVRLKSFSERVDAWNSRTAEFNQANRSGPAADRQRRELATERTDLDKLRAELEAEKTRFSASSDAAVRGYNEKAAALDARATAWNVRNKQFNETSTALEGERQTWISNCANRRYRENDETAIRSGK